MSDGSITEVLNQMGLARDACFDAITTEPLSELQRNSHAAYLSLLPVEAVRCKHGHEQKSGDTLYARHGLRRFGHRDQRTALRVVFQHVFEGITASAALSFV